MKIPADWSISRLPPSLIWVLCRFTNSSPNQARRSRPPETTRIFQKPPGRETAEAFADQALVKRIDLRQLYGRWKEKARAVALLFIEWIYIFPALAYARIGSNRKNNYVFLRPVETFGRDNNRGTEFYRGEVSEGERDEYNITGAIGCCTVRHTDCSRTQKTVPTFSAERLLPERCGEFSAGELKTAVVPREALFGSVPQSVLWRVWPSLSAIITREALFG